MRSLRTSLGGLAQRFRGYRGRVLGGTGGPRPRTVDLGQLRRAYPVSRQFGLDRGRAIDRAYIEDFLAANSASVKGSVLEVGDNVYTLRYGTDLVTRSAVLHAVEGNPQATYVGDLASGRGLPRSQFDCVICTQTLQCIYDIHGAVRTLFRILAPGGTALVTLPGISQISRYDYDRWGEFWRFTSLSAQRLFANEFGDGAVQVRAYGNALSSIAFLSGLAQEDLTRGEVMARDEDYEIIIAVRAVKGQCP